MTTAYLERAFPNEDACDAYLVARRWSDAVLCPRCGSLDVYSLVTRKLLWVCRDCRKRGSFRFTHTTGTVFQNTKVDLRTWFRVVHMMLVSDQDITVRRLHRVMGTGTYQTMWYLCHRIRTALLDREFQKLIGIVEAGND